MTDLMMWRIERRAGMAVPDLPSAIMTAAPKFRHDDLPAEAGLLLPTNAGPTRLIDDIAAHPSACRGAIVGLFLANPFLDVPLEAGRLRRAGVGWVANLPTVEQQDEEVRQQLADVGLDHQREVAGLAAFAAAGFRVAVAVADEPGARRAVAIGPDALIVVPRIADFVAGFPSQRKLGAAAQAVREAAQAAGWHGPLIGTGDDSTAAHETLWPAVLDAVVRRPVIVGLAPD